MCKAIQVWIGSITLVVFSLDARAAVSFVQQKANSFQSVSSASVGLSTATTAGDLVIVGIYFGPSSSISSVTDSQGNAYTQIGTALSSPTNNQSTALFFANNTRGGPETVTVRLTAVPQNTGLAIYVFEYKGVAAVSPLDGNAQARGTSSSVSSGTLTTTVAHDLLFGFCVSDSSCTKGNGFTARSTFESNLGEDKILNAAGANSATATANAPWTIHAAAFKAASADTTSPTVPTGLAATAVSISQINLSWNASTDNVGVTGYRVYRHGTQIAQVTTTSYQNTGLAPATAYSYTVSAYDAAGNVSAQSSAVSATTLPDTTAPSVPTNLTSSVISSSQINLAWSASSDNVGVAGYRVFRNGSQVAQTSGTSYADTGLPSGTTYSYTVAAYDAAGNVSAQSSAVSATTLFVDTTAPSVPTGFTATGISVSQINLSWTASTDDVGVAGYRVFRDNAQIATTGSTTSYADQGLAPSTTYVYAVAAFDATGNISGQSTATPGTTFADTTAPSVPAGLTATPISSSQVNLSWNASTDDVGVTGYRLFRDGSQIATTTTNGYGDTGLAAATTYSYAVAAFDAAGNLSGTSNSVSVTTPSASLTSYGLEWPGDGSVRRMLYWHNPFPIYDATYIFKVYPRKKTGSVNYYTTFFWGNDGAFSWNNGNPNTYYGAHPYPIPAPTGPGQWEISVNANDFVTGTEVQWNRWHTQAFRAWRESPSITHHEFYYDWPDTTKVISTTINDATWANQNPPVPAIVMGQAPNVNGLSWGGYPGWEEFNGIIRGIQIYSGLLSLADIQSEISSAKSTSAGQSLMWYLNTDPRPGDVTDKKGIGTPHDPSWDGTTAQEWASQTFTDTQAPTAPTNLAASGSLGAATLNWIASTDNVGVALYNIYRSTTPGFVASATTEIGQATSTTFTDVVAAGTYYYLVTAEDDAGNLSVPSNEAGATVTADTIPPSAPTNLVATPISSSQINITWTASPDNVAVAGYQVFRNGSQIATSTSTSYSDTGLAASTTYTYTVTAFDSSGNVSSASQAVNAATLAGSPLPSGVIAAYTFDEGTGTTTADLSGNGRTGTLVNSPVWSAGKYGNALSYNGVNSYVSITNTFDIAALPFTIAAWVNPTNYNDYRKVFSKRTSWASNSMRVDLTLNITNGHVMLEQPSSVMNFSYSPPLNTWTHIAVVARSTGTDLYVNGTLTQTLGAFTLGTSASAQVRVGLAGDGQDPFLGRIDNLRIYSRALSQPEVQTDMNTPAQ